MGAAAAYHSPSGLRRSFLREELATAQGSA